MRRVYNIDETNSERNGRHIVITYREASDNDTIDGAVAQRCIAEWSQNNADAVTSFIHGDIDADELISTLAHDDVSAKADEVAEKVCERLERMSDHITTDGRHVFYDNATFEHIRLDEVLEDHLVRLLQEGGIDGAKGDDAFMAYCRFAERLYGNTDARIREQLVRWLEAQGWLTFDMQGRLIGYRGVQTGEDGVAESIHRGPGYVDGKRVNGHVPNPDGAVIEIDRDIVVNDPSCGCSVGLHVGTYDYASSWAMSAGHGPLLLRVAVAPEDVISVPFDCSAQKIRCCRFEVLEHEELSPELKEQYERQLAYHDSDYADTDCLYDDYPECVVDVVADAWVGAGRYHVTSGCYDGGCSSHEAFYQDVDGLCRDVTDALADEFGLDNIYDDDGNVYIDVTFVRHDGDVKPESDDNATCSCTGKHFGDACDCHADEPAMPDTVKPVDCRDFVGKRVSFAYKGLDGSINPVRGTVDGAGTFDTSMRVAVDGGGHARYYADRVIGGVIVTNDDTSNDDSADGIDKAPNRIRDAFSGLMGGDGTIHIPIG